MTAKHYIYNAPDKMDKTGKWLKSYTDELHTKSLSRSGQLWMNVQTRCAVKYQSNNPTYKGVTCNFNDFQEFAEWCQSQQGYMNKDGERFWQLDKDLLFPGNKVYSENLCMFVPSEVNNLFHEPRESNGLKLGVSICRSDNLKFQASCRVGMGKTKHLGVFTNEESAHEAWKVTKADHIGKLISKYSDYHKVVDGILNKSKSIGIHVCCK